MWRKHSLNYILSNTKRLSNEKQPIKIVNIILMELIKTYMPNGKNKKIKSAKSKKIVDN